MIRPALFADIPQLCSLMAEAHQHSKYAEYRMDMKAFKTLCMEMMRSGNGYVWVAERDDVVRGFLIGMVDDLYHVLAAKYATDLFFYVSPGAPGGAGLLKRFIKWAKACPRVVRIRMGVTNMLGDIDRIERLYERIGFLREGSLYEMEV